MRRAGFSRRGRGEAASADDGTGAAVDDVLQHIVHQIGDARVECRPCPRLHALNCAAVGTDHAVDEHRLGAHAAIGKDGVPGCHFHRRHLVGAQGYRGCRLDPRVEADLPRDFNHATVAHLLGHLDRGDIERARQRLAQRDGAVKLLAVVIRSVFLAVELKRSGLVHHRCCRGHDWADAVDDRAKGGSVHERLEH